MSNMGLIINDVISQRGGAGGQTNDDLGADGAGGGWSKGKYVNIHLKYMAIPKLNLLMSSY